MLTCLHSVIHVSFARNHFGIQRDFALPPPHHRAKPTEVRGRLADWKGQGGPKWPPDEARVVLVGGLQWKTERERHAYMAWPAHCSEV